MATGLAIVGIGAMVGGSILQSKAQKAGSRAEAEGLEFQAQAARDNAVARSDAALFNADTAESNKIIAERSAFEAIDRGSVSELVARFQTKDLIGRQTVKLAASGQVVGQGSANDIVSDTAAIGEFEALNIRFNAKQEAQNFLDQAFNFGRDADLLTMESESALRAGALSERAGLEAASSTRKIGKQQAAGTLISGIGQAGFAAGSFFKAPVKPPVKT